MVMTAVTVPGRGTGVAGREAGAGCAGGTAGLLHLPRIEMVWDFLGVGTAVRSAGSRSRCWGSCVRGAAGDHVSGEQLDWQVIVRLVSHCRHLPQGLRLPGPGDGAGARAPDREGPGSPMRSSRCC